MLVLYNNHVCTGINFFLFTFYFVNYTSHNRCIFLFFYTFPIERCWDRCWHRNKMISWFITVMNFQTVLYLSFSPVLLGVDVNWLFVIIKSYVKVNFKEKNDNDDNFVLKIFNFLSWLFGHLEKAPWLRLNSKLMVSQSG